MIRILVAAVVALALLPSAASAHPLGNFSVNHLSQVSVSSDRVDVRYILDEAEIPTFQQRGTADATLLARKQAEVERRLALTVDGRRVALRPAGMATISHPEGQGGLKTTRVELPLTARVDDPRKVELRDGTFPGRVGWKAIVVEPGRGTAVRSSAPAGDPTDGLRKYPEDLLKSPSDVRSASFAVSPGSGTVDAPDGRRAAGTRGGDDGLRRRVQRRGRGQGRPDPAAAVGVRLGRDPRAVPGPRQGDGRRLPGRHARDAEARGRARRDRDRDAHDRRVRARRRRAALSEYILPEDLYPWLNLASGRARAAWSGAGVLRSRIRWARARHATTPRSPPSSPHDHDARPRARPRARALARRRQAAQPRARPSASRGRACWRWARRPG